MKILMKIKNNQIVERSKKLEYAHLFKKSYQGLDSSYYYLTTETGEK